MDIGKRISFFRNAKQYSVNRLATMAGISQSYLRDVELGKKNPTVEVLSYVCEALDISLRASPPAGSASGPDLPDESETEGCTSSVFRLYG